MPASRRAIWVSGDARTRRPARTQPAAPPRSYMLELRKGGMWEWGKVVRAVGIPPTIMMSTSEGIDESMTMLITLFGG